MERWCAKNSIEKTGCLQMDGKEKIDFVRLDSLKLLGFKASNGIWCMGGQRLLVRIDNFMTHTCMRDKTPYVLVEFLSLVILLHECPFPAPSLSLSMQVYGGC